MSDFLSFARAHGIVIDHEPPLGVWRRYKTLDKPGKRNGAVKLMGDYGFVQNHAIDVEVAVWKRDERSAPVAQRELAQLRERDARRRAQAMHDMRAHFFSL